jgi:hypothetical protein
VRDLIRHVHTAIGFPASLGPAPESMELAEWKIRTKASNAFTTFNARFLVFLYRSYTHEPNDLEATHAPP